MRQSEAGGRIAGTATSTKVRNIVTPSGGILRGHLASAKFKKRIKWEGSLERDLLMLAEFSTHIHALDSQPFRTVFVYAGRLTSRTPDFALYTDIGRLIAECKPAAKLLDPAIAEQLRIAALQYQDLGYIPKIVTDTALRAGAALANARDLWPYRLLPMQPQADHDRVANLRDLLKPFAPLTWHEALLYLGSKRDLQILIASRYLTFDFSQPLAERTTLHLDPLRHECDAAACAFI